jgi:hypothetical protein
LHGLDQPGLGDLLLGWKNGCVIPCLLVHTAMAPLGPVLGPQIARRSWLAVPAYLGQLSRTTWLQCPESARRMWVELEGVRLELDFTLKTLSRRALHCLPRGQRWWIVLLTGDVHLWPLTHVMDGGAWAPEQDVPERMWTGTVYTGLDPSVPWMAISASSAVVALATSGPITSVTTPKTVSKVANLRTLPGPFRCPAYFLKGEDACVLTFKHMSLNEGRPRIATGKSARVQSAEDSEDEPLNDFAANDVGYHLEIVDCVRRLVLQRAAAGGDNMRCLASDFEDHPCTLCFDTCDQLLVHLAFVPKGCMHRFMHKYCVDGAAPPPWGHGLSAGQGILLNSRGVRSRSVVRRQSSVPAAPSQVIVRVLKGKALAARAALFPSYQHGGMGIMPRPGECVQSGDALLFGGRQVSTDEMSEREPRGGLEHGFPYTPRVLRERYVGFWGIEAPPDPGGQSWQGPRNAPGGQGMRVNEASVEDTLVNALFHGQAMVAMGDIRYEQWLSQYGSGYAGHRARAGYSAAASTDDMGAIKTLTPDELLRLMPAQTGDPVSLGEPGSAGHLAAYALAAGVDLEGAHAPAAGLQRTVTNTCQPGRVFTDLVTHAPDTMMDSEWSADRDADLVATLVGRPLVVYHRAGHSVHVPRGSLAVDQEAVVSVLRVPKVTPGYEYLAVAPQPDMATEAYGHLQSKLAWGRPEASLVCLGFSILPPAPVTSVCWVDTKPTEGALEAANVLMIARMSTNDSWAVISACTRTSWSVSCRDHLPALAPAAEIVARCLLSGMAAALVLACWFRPSGTELSVAPQAKWQAHVSVQEGSFTYLPELRWLPGPAAGFLALPTQIPRDRRGGPLKGRFTHAVAMRLGAGMALPLGDLLGELEGTWLLQVVEHTYAPMLVYHTIDGTLPHPTDVRTLRAPNWVAGESVSESRGIWIFFRSDTTLALATRGPGPPPIGLERWRMGPDRVAPSPRHAPSIPTVTPDKRRAAGGVDVTVKRGLSYDGPLVRVMINWTKSLAVSIYWGAFGMDSFGHQEALLAEPASLVLALTGPAPEYHIGGVAYTADSIVTGDDWSNAVCSLPHAVLAEMTLLAAEGAARDAPPVDWNTLLDNARKRAEAPHVSSADPRSREVQRHWRNCIVQMQREDGVMYYVQSHPPLSFPMPKSASPRRVFDTEVERVGGIQYPDPHDVGRVIVQLPRVVCDAADINPAAIYHYNGGPPMQTLAYATAVRASQGQGAHIPCPAPPIPLTTGQRHASMQASSPGRKPVMIRWPLWPLYRWEILSAVNATTKFMPPLLRNRATAIGWMEGPADTQRPWAQQTTPYVRCVSEHGLELLAFVLTVSSMSAVPLDLRSEKEACQGSGWSLALGMLRRRLVLWLSPTQVNQSLADGIMTGEWAASVQGRNLLQCPAAAGTIQDVTTWARGQADLDCLVLLVRCQGQIEFEQDMWSRKGPGTLQLVGILEQASKRALVRTSTGVRLMSFKDSGMCPDEDPSSDVGAFGNPWLIMVRVSAEAALPCCHKDASASPESYWCARCAVAVLCTAGRHRWRGRNACKNCAILEGSMSALCSHCHLHLTGPTVSCSSCSSTAHRGCAGTWRKHEGSLHCPSASCMPWSNMDIAEAHSRCVITNCGDVDWSEVGTVRCSSCTRLVCQEHAEGLPTSGLCPLCRAPRAPKTPKTPKTPKNPKNPKKSKKSKKLKTPKSSKAGPGPRKGVKRARHNV